MPEVSMGRQIDSVLKINANVHTVPFTVLADAERALVEEVRTLARSGIPLGDVLAHIYTAPTGRTQEDSVRVVLSTPHGMVLFGMQIAAADPDKWLWFFRFVSKKLKSMGIANIVPMSRSVLCQIEYEFYTDQEKVASSITRHLRP